MRVRRVVVVVVVLVLVVVVIGGGFVVFAVRGADAPPPPALSEPAVTSTATPARDNGRASTYEVAQPTFVGYRVREKYVTFGVADAVGRTGNVTGTAQVDRNTITEADLTTDMTTLRSDESRRDTALSTRAIETARYRTSRFVLKQPFAISRNPTQAKGDLTLHGKTRPIEATVQGQRLNAGIIELAGEAPIDFKAFRIDPPSVAGFVTVEDHGTLEFKLRLEVR